MNTDNFFTNVPSSKVTDGYLGNYTIRDNVEVSTAMKLDSSATLEFTATKDNMVIELVISTRYEGTGKVYIDNILNDGEMIVKITKLLMENIQLLPLNLKKMLHINFKEDLLNKS